MAPKTSSCVLHRGADGPRKLNLNPESGLLVRSQPASQKPGPIPPEWILPSGIRANFTESELAQTPTRDWRWELNQLEYVIGQEDRIQVDAPGQWPYSAHGLIITTFPNRRSYIGSGTVIHSRHVLTAAHNLYSAARGGWAQDVVFVPGKCGDSEPFGQFMAVRCLCPSEYIEGLKPAFYDYGVLVLHRDVAPQTGAYGLKVLSTSELSGCPVTIVGYPGEPSLGSGRKQWLGQNRIHTVSDELVTYEVDTSAGESGSGVYIQAGSEYLIVAIHTVGSMLGNQGVRVNMQVFQACQEWMSLS